MKNAYVRKNFLLIVCVLAIAASITFIGRLWADSSESSGSKPAVSKLNAKVGGAYADFDSASTGYGTASVTLPLGHRFGLSVDGLGGSYDSDSLWGAGGSLFWRNPDKGLLGIIGSNVKVGSNNAYRGGATGELYLGNFSILSDVGYLNGETINAGAFADLQLRWYALKNLAVSAGCAYANNVTAGLVGMEYMFDKVLPGVALFVDGSWGGDGYHSVMGGARYYFGGTGKTLKEKHREDDPPNNALQGLVLCSQGNCFAKEESTPPSGDDIKGDDDIVTDDIADDDIADDIITDIAPN